MNVALRARMTMEEFLAWESGQDLKWEFDGTHPVAMAGGTAEHAGLQRNLAIAIGGRLQAGPCQFFGSDLQFRTGHSVRYPDGMVVCSPVPRGATFVDNPTVVFEILSSSSQSTDRIDKNREYAGTESVRRYVMLEQDRVAATVFERSGERWASQVLVAGDTLAMPEIGVSVPLDELYSRIDLAAVL